MVKLSQIASAPSKSKPWSLMLRRRLGSSQEVTSKLYIQYTWLASNCEALASARSNVNYAERVRLHLYLARYSLPPNAISPPRFYEPQASCSAGGPGAQAARRS